MSKKIIIAGGGHGGITCGAILAKNGYDVTVYERNDADKMGHDWTDIFDPKAFKAVGMDMPEREMYEFKKQIVMFNDICYGSSVKFEADKIGHITVSGEIFGKAMAHSLKFSFTTDQFVLKQFISELEHIIGI